MRFGLTFSTKYSSDLGLDPQNTFRRALNDFNFSSIRIPVYWDRVEPNEGELDIKELLFFLNAAKFKGLEITLSIGRKVPRWPEYHQPQWTNDMTEDAFNQSYLNYLNQVLPLITKYSDFDFIQVENEPLYNFGNAKYKLTKDFFEREISVVKSLISKPIVITESGEGRDWVEAGNYGDKIGINMYAVVYDGRWHRYYRHNKKPDFYIKKKSKVNKDVFVSELQAEPWGPGGVRDLSVDEIKKSISSEQLKQNIELAKQSGFEEVWMWGVEWWYFIENQMPEILQTAKEIINS